LLPALCTPSTDAPLFTLVLVIRLSAVLPGCGYSPVMDSLIPRSAVQSYLRVKIQNG